MNDPHAAPPGGEQQPVPPAHPPAPPAAPPWGAAPPPPPGFQPPTNQPPTHQPPTYVAPPPQPGAWGAPPAGAGYGGYGGYGGQTPAQPYQPGGWQSMAPIRTAEPGLRIAAKFIDIVIVVTIQVILGIITAVVVGASLLTSSSSDPSGFTGGGAFSNPFGGANILAGLVVGLITIGIDYIYNVVFVARFGGQPGKLMLGLRIVAADGSSPSTATAIRRWSPILAMLVIGMLPIVSIFGSIARFVLLIANLVLVFADDRRRSVFDHVGGTMVVTAR